MLGGFITLFSRNLIQSWWGWFEKKKQNKTKGWPIFKPVLQISEKDVVIDTANSSAKNFSQSDERYASAVFTISFFISLEHFSESHYFLLLILC